MKTDPNAAPDSLMAEPDLSAPPGPVLGSTADEAPYVPVSWLAVAAAACAGLLGLFLVIMGWIAFRSKRPLLEEELLVLAILAVVLSFAARRMIRNSEGTRTGKLFSVDLPNAAWWGGLILGLGYVSYLLAIEFSIRNDAKGEVQAWSDFVMKGDEESLNRAFHRTQDPGQRKNVSPTKGEVLEARWGKDYIAFQQTELRRLIKRNGADCKLELGGLRDWRYLPTGIECVYTATLTCPEGTFPLLIPMKGVDGSAAGVDGGGRQWQILHYPATGYIDRERVRFTPYGWFVAQLGIAGADQVRSLLAASTLRETRAGILLDFVPAENVDVADLRPLTIGGLQGRAAAVGNAAAIAYTPGRRSLNLTADHLFRLPGGEKPDAGRLETFRKVWFETGIVRAGERLRESTDTNDQIIFTDDAILYRMPIEIPLSASRGDITAARGGVVLRCNDPAIVAEAKRLRASADPAVGTDRPDASFGTRAIPWRLLRIESELKPIRMEPPKMPGAGPPPG